MNQSIQVSNEGEVLQFQDFEAMKRSRLFFLENQKYRLNQLSQKLCQLNALCCQLKDRFHSMEKGDQEELTALDDEKKQLIKRLKQEKERKAIIQSEKLKLKDQIEFFESMNLKEQQKREEQKLLADFKKVQTEMKNKLESLTIIKGQLEQKQQELFELELEKINKSFEIEENNKRLEKKEGEVPENQQMSINEIVQLTVSFLAKLKGKDQSRAKNMILNYARSWE